jgi:hypothetical protein
MGGVVMAERAMGAAGFWPRRTVRVATRVLPGATRDRYRQEFLAELYGLGRARQLRHALGVLSRCWALRDAINTPSPAAAADMEIVFPRRRRPLFCRLNLRHRWATLRTEDGKPYLRCQRCGKDETDIYAGSRIDPRDVLDDVPPPPPGAAYGFFGSGPGGAG